MKYFIPAIIWGTALTILSLMSGSKVPDLSFIKLFQPDKIGHFIAYAMFVALILFGCYKTNTSENIPYSTVVKVLILVIGYGIVIEWLQFSFSEGRYFEVPDIIANIIGCITGLLSLKLFNKKII